jgi:hypothetical protein
LNTVATENEQGFEYIDLNEIDPSFKALPEAFYTLRVLKAERKTFDYKNGPKAGTSGDMLKFQFAVTDDPSYSGRRLFPAVFPGNKRALRGLRKLADATGIQQEPGTAIDTWLAALTEVQPTFKQKVKYAAKWNKDTQQEEVVLNEKGEPADNDVDWAEIQPA